MSKFESDFLKVETTFRERKFLTQGCDGQVGGCYPEASTVSNVLDALDESVRVNVGISSVGCAVEGAGFVLGAETIGVTVRVLSELILSVVLGFRGQRHGWECVRSGVSQRSGGGNIRGVSCYGGISEGPGGDNSRYDSRRVDKSTLLAAKTSQSLAVGGKVSGFSGDHLEINGNVTISSIG